MSEVDEERRSRLDFLLVASWLLRDRVCAVAADAGRAGAVSAAVGVDHARFEFHRAAAGRWDARLHVALLAAESSAALVAARARCAVRLARIERPEAAHVSSREILAREVDRRV